MKVLLTGGCGFIGSAVVRHLIRDTDHVVINVDKLTYAALRGRAGGCAAATTATCLIRADITDAAAMRQIFATHAARRGDAPRGGKPCRSLDRRAGRFIADQCGRHVHPAGGGARTTGAALAAARRAAFRFHHVSTDEVFGALGADDPPFNEDHALRSAQPLFGEQGSLRPSGARLVPHLRPADPRLQHAPTITGPGNFPEKLIPLVIAERAGGQAAAGLWRRLEPARLAVRRGPCRRAGARAGTRRAGATYAIGARSRAAISTWCARSARELDRRVPDPAGARERLIHFVTDRPGHDFRYEIDPTRAETALGWTAPHDFEAGLARTIDWYLANRDWWQAVRAGRYARTTVGQLRHERHSARRRLRHAAASDDLGGVEAVAAGLRQTDGLLPAVDADACRHPRHPGDLDARGPAAVPASCSARASASACTSPTPNRRAPRGSRRPS